MQRLLAFFLIILTLPLYPFIFLAISLSSPGPYIFKQIRLGKNKIPFTIYKFRTMYIKADDQKKLYIHLNELEWPLFKMSNDPRLTWIGKFLIKFGIDELPQLRNIIEGDMSFVGPRPFPVDEALKIPKKYDKRYLVKPGITGLWVLKGYHKLTLDEWMRTDIEYAINRTALGDMVIFLKTLILLITRG